MFWHLSSALRVSYLAVYELIAVGHAAGLRSHIQLDGTNGPQACRGDSSD